MNFMFEHLLKLPLSRVGPQLRLLQQEGGSHRYRGFCGPDWAGARQEGEERRRLPGK